MLKTYTKGLVGILLLLICSCFAGTSFAQTSISGKITDAETGEGLVGVNILVKGTVTGTVTNVDGAFKLQTTVALPFKLAITAIGYSSQEIEVKENNQVIELKLSSQAMMLGQEVVVSASKVEEKILESPVTVEKMDILAIRNTPAPSFYDALQNIKGVEMSTQSFTFKSFNTRGFNANGNVRTVQMIDGMDNQAPGLNFPLGNIVGMSELDLESMELLPGAASALYGPNAINGILLMNSKNPFNYQGLSAYVKTGLMSDDNRTQANSGMYDVAVRYAKAFNDKFAFKVNINYVRADDWQSYDYRDQGLINGTNINTGTRNGNVGYNGVNVYGDETNVNMLSSLAPALATNTTLRGLSGLTGQSVPSLINLLIPNVNVSRGGYNEVDLANYKAESIKLNAALHYRISEKVEALVQGSFGTGTTVYTGADRYSLTGFYLAQFKAEIRGANFYVRAYTTMENSGDSYAIGTLGVGINEAWKPSSTWFPQYFQTYASSAIGAFGLGLQSQIAQGVNPAQAFANSVAAVNQGSAGFHQNARSVADQGRFLEGSAEFNNAAAGVKSRPIPGNAQGVGAKFTDKTNMYQFEGMYNFSNQIKFAEIIVGANYRIYDLNSEKTLFALQDDGNEFTIYEYGGYIQASKKLFEDKLKLSGSVRYDKNQNFEGQFNPRASAVFTFAKTHNIRASFQTGFRIPTTQNQYIDLATPQARLTGGLPLFQSRYNMINNPVYTIASVTAFGAALQAGQSPATAVGLLKKFEFREFKPERILSYELGYKGLIANKLLVDAYYYHNTYTNFIGTAIVAQTQTVGAPVTALLSGTTRNVYSFPATQSFDVKAQGWALGLDYQLPKGYNIGGNVSYNELLNESDIEAGGSQSEFNSSPYRFNINFANRNAYKNLGFSVAYRWQDQLVWQSSFVGQSIANTRQSIVPAYGALDAQVSYKMPKQKLLFKLGGANLFGKPYTQAWGNPSIGTMYYLQVTFDQALN